MAVYILDQIMSKNDNSSPAIGKILKLLIRELETMNDSHNND